MASQRRASPRVSHVAPATGPLTRISLRVASPKASTPPVGKMTFKLRTAAATSSAAANPSIRVTPPKAPPSKTPLVVSLRPPTAPAAAAGGQPSRRRAVTAPTTPILGAAAAPASASAMTGTPAIRVTMPVEQSPPRPAPVPYVEPDDATLVEAETIIRGQLREYLDEYDRADEPFPMDDAHVLAALSSRLPPYRLSAEECALFPHYLLTETRYCEHRNRILALWFERPRTWLTRDEALAHVMPADEPMVSDIYAFLARAFYINFGVLPTPAPPTTADAWPNDPVRVLVVGAGIAGLATVRALHQAGLQAVAFEARDRLGGRVNAVPLTSPRSDEGRGAVHGARYVGDGLDLGASIITGFGGGNPLAVLALQLQLGIQVLQASCPLYGTDGRELPTELDQRAEALFNELMDEAALLRNAEQDQSLDEGLSRAWTKLTPPPTLEETRVVGWHIANLEFANATPLRALSLKQWDQDDGHEFSGEHTMIRGGYGQFAAGLGSGLDVCFSSPVTAVHYGPGWASLTLADGSVHTGNAVVVTSSLGVLQRNLIQFDPPLPERKQLALRRMGFGGLNKVALVFETPFWLEHENPTDIFGCVQKGDRGLFFMFYNLTGILRRPALVGLISGEAAYKVENWTPDKIIEGALETLRRAFGRQRVTTPIQAAVSNWATDEYCFGSYSSIPPGAFGEDYDALAEPVGDSLFFAGEATNRYFPATVHGAYMSGVREASRILNIHHPLQLHGAATEAPVAKFETPLRCEWTGCGAELGPTEHLRDHIILHHLPPSDRERLYRERAQVGIEYVKHRSFGARLEDGREGSPAPGNTSALGGGQLAAFGGNGGGRGRKRMSRPAPARRREEADPARVQELLPVEVNAVTAIGSSMRSYLIAKDTVMDYIKRHGPIRKRDARILVKINVNHTSKFYDLWARLGWITVP